MKKITTEHFELALYTSGDINAEKMVLCLPGRLDTKDYKHMRHTNSTLAIMFGVSSILWAIHKKRKLSNI